MNLLEMSIALGIMNNIPENLQNDYSVEDIENIFDAEIRRIEDQLLGVVGDIIIDPIGFNKEIVNQKLEEFKESDEYAAINQQIVKKIIKMNDC